LYFLLNSTSNLWLNIKLKSEMVLGAVAAIAIGIVVLIVFFAIAGFLIQLLAPVIAGILILIVAVAGGAWLYAKYKGR
jgi:hypothetical protein